MAEVSDEEKELLALVSQLAAYEEEHRLFSYQPYKKQKDFHHAKSNGKLAQQRCFMAGNKSGKTMSAAMETAMHLTGLYPEWWEGHRFERPINALVAGVSNESTRDNPQNELFGDPFNDEKLGTKAVPKDCIVRKVKKAGLKDCYDSVLVQHYTEGKPDGISTCMFRSYEQGFKKFMGIQFDVGWADEEPPSDIWSQYLRGTIAKEDAIIYMTFTPEEGMTDVVEQFLNNPQKGQVVINMTWDDIIAEPNGHITEETKEQRLNAFPQHEREMRSKGVPMMGTGLIFPVPDEDLIAELEIQPWWPRICGIDLGWDHPFAAAWIAWDRDADLVYLYDEFVKSECLLPVAASAIKARGDWIPVIWPHDAMKHDPQSGAPMVDLLRKEGVNCLPDKFSNPPPPGKKEGQGGNGREAGIMEMLNRMNTGRFKVSPKCQHFFEEKRMYHRKNGKIVDIRDDMMSATRYAVMSLRKAYTMPVRQKVKMAQGVKNW